jgi:hypothetical protein
VPNSKTWLYSTLECEGVVDVRSICTLLSVWCLFAHHVPSLAATALGHAQLRGIWCVLQGQNSRPDRQACSCLETSRFVRLFGRSRTSSDCYQQLSGGRAVHGQTHQ